MLANGREAMVRRAVRAWLSQSYPESHRMLLILDTGSQSLVTAADAEANAGRGLVHVPRYSLNGQTIGALRNDANRRTNAEIILHWDSDDWSHPNRIAEQVARLEASGKEAVGYRDMLFWNTTMVNNPAHMSTEALQSGAIAEIKQEAWLYTNRVPTYCLGTSLCYWRKTWLERPFENTSAGEDTIWLREVKSEGASSCPTGEMKRNFDAITAKLHPDAFPLPEHLRLREPRMIASIHGGNTYAKIEPRAEEWRRVPEWDDHCREIMAL